MKILYEDEYSVVAVKDVGVMSEYSETEKNMVSLLKDKTKSEIFPVSRLDTPVGGVMVFAKNQKSAGELTRQMGDGTLKKTYLAVVHSSPQEKTGTFEDLLFKDSRKNKSFVVKRERKGVKKASLSYRVLDEKNNLSLVEIHLHTGRTHQIRVQFSSRRMPLVGDGKYGAKDNAKNIGLFCKEITFKKINSEEVLNFSAECENIYPWNLFYN